jgi:signal transduction histidine kinase
VNHLAESTPKREKNYKAGSANDAGPQKRISDHQRVRSGEDCPLRADSAGIRYTREQTGECLEMTTRKWLPVMLPFSIGSIASAVYSSFEISSEYWGQVLASLYYIPIVIAAIVPGVPSALSVALAAGIVHTIAATLGHGDPWIGPIAQTLLFVCVAITAARLAQWRTGGLRGIALEQPKGSLATGGDSFVLSRMIVGLVRQFRTPLTSIEGAGWVLEDPKLADNKRRELVGIVRKETHRLNRILMDVLEFTQPRSPRFRMIDLSKLVDDVIQLAGTKDGRRFTITKNIPPDLPMLRGDPEQMKQVLLNLIVNSNQAMPAGGEVEISARIEGDTFVIAVRDHGTGVPAAAADRIFEPFFSTDEHRLGLGLALAMQIVRDHGGRIMVDKEETEGARILVLLPRRDANP